MVPNLRKKTKDLNLDHIISRSSYNNDFHKDFLAICEKDGGILSIWGMR